jgi:hypothetical protein
MIEIRQINIRACPDFRDNIRAPRAHDMKTFVAGTAIKFLMIISESTAVCKITISSPGFAAMVDDATMTREASGVYSYNYQTPSDDTYTGKWVVTFSATADTLTMLTQDKFTLVSQTP